MNPNELKPGDRIMIPAREATVIKVEPQNYTGNYPAHVAYDDDEYEWVHRKSLSHAHFITPDKPVAVKCCGRCDGVNDICIADEDDDEPKSNKVADKDNFQFRYDGSEEGLRAVKMFDGNYTGCATWYGKRNGCDVNRYHQFESLPIVTIPEAVRLMGGEVGAEWKVGNKAHHYDELHQEWNEVIIIAIDSGDVWLNRDKYPDVAFRSRLSALKPIPTAPTMEEELRMIVNNSNFISQIVLEERILAWHTKHQPSIPSVSEFAKYYSTETDGTLSSCMKQAYAHFGMDKIARDK